MSRPLGRSTYFTVNGGSIVAGTNDSFAWVVLDTHGMPQPVSKAPGLERAVTPAVIGQFQDMFMAFSETGEQEREITSLLEDYPLPEELPAFRDIKVDPTGRVWIAKYKVTPTDESVWYVFSASGKLLGKADIPSDLTVHEIGVDFVLGVRRDEFDVPYIVRVPMTPIE